MVTFNTQHTHVSHFLTVILGLDESKTWAVDSDVDDVGFLGEKANG